MNDSSGWVLGQKFAAKKLQPGEELQPAATLLTCLNHLEPGVLPEKPKLVCTNALVEWQPLFIEWHEVDGKSLGGWGGRHTSKEYE